MFLVLYLLCEIKKLLNKDVLRIIMQKLTFVSAHSFLSLGVYILVPSSTTRTRTRQEIDETLLKVIRKHYSLVLGPERICVFKRNKA